MGATLAVATLKHTNGLAKSNYVNTFAISHASSTPGTPGEITTAIAAFYNGIATGNTVTVSSRLSGEITRATGGCSIQLYNIGADLGGTPHGSPFFTDAFTMSAPVDSMNLPSEVACCLTWTAVGRHLEAVSGDDNSDPSGVDDPDSLRDRPMQRRTGRIYVGPLNGGAHSNGRPSTGFMTILNNAGKALSVALAARASGPYVLGVWSRKNAGIYPVGGSFVDDAFDTQRRRGAAPTARAVLAY
jgi:hypothetical protein